MTRERLSMLHDGFDEVVEYAHDHLPPPSTPGGPRATPWEALMAGKTVGKRSVVRAPAVAAESSVVSQVDSLHVSGPDEFTQQLCLTISPPKVVTVDPTTIPASTAIQNLTGEGDNVDLFTQGNFPGLARPLNWTECFARITWGSGGVSQTVDVDINNGCCVNLCGSSVRVTIFCGPRINDGVSTDDAFYVFGCYLGPGYPKSLNGQRTIYMGNVGGTPSETTPQPIPRFAKQATLMMANAVAPGAVPNVMTGWLRFWQRSDATGLLNLANFFFASNSFQPVDVPSAAKYFSVQNGDAAVNKMSVCFDLSV